MIIEPIQVLFIELKCSEFLLLNTGGYWIVKYESLFRA
jgi:hypothetical protein